MFTVISSTSHSLSLLLLSLLSPSFSPSRSLDHLNQPSHSPLHFLRLSLSFSSSLASLDHHRAFRCCLLNRLFFIVLPTSESSCILKLVSVWSQRKQLHASINGDSFIEKVFLSLSLSLDSPLIEVNLERLDRTLLTCRRDYSSHFDPQTTIIVTISSLSPLLSLHGLSHSFC